MKKGTKIKYTAGHIYCGEEVVYTGYLLSIDGDWAWVARTKESYNSGIGRSIHTSDIIGPASKRKAGAK